MPLAWLSCTLEQDRVDTQLKTTLLLHHVANRGLGPGFHRGDSDCYTQSRSRSRLIRTTSSPGRFHQFSAEKISTSMGPS